MQSKATTVKEYVDSLAEDRKKPIEELRKVIRKNLPKGFEECMNYGMIGYVVPHKLYPPGYHCTPELPLPYMNIASQKNFIAVYSFGMYNNKKVLDWFLKEYSKSSGKKVDMGKSCLRFKKAEDIPYRLIGELAGKMTPQEWIDMYEKTVKNRPARKK